MKIWVLRPEDCRLSVALPTGCAVNVIIRSNLHPLDRCISLRIPWVLPVQEALEASHAHPRMRLDVRRVLLIEMHKRRRPFWNWTTEEWFEILCSTAVAFAQRYPGAAMCRQQVLTVAYLLCGFTDFHKLGAFLRKTLADPLLVLLVWRPRSNGWLRARDSGD